MNVEFHYYSTAFLAVKAGFSLEDAAVLAYSGQYVDHHLRTLEIDTPRGRVVGVPTQNYSFWDPATVNEVLAPFHFFPSGEEGTRSSVRADGGVSAWDVRPNSSGVKTLLVEALKSRDLYRIGLALHTFSDSWAHQNFTARDEAWNRINGSRLPAPGHAQAGWEPDLWLSEWDDQRLSDPAVVNSVRFGDCARKIYRYLCTYQGKDFRQDEEAVAGELLSLVETGRGRDRLEDRVVEFVLLLNLEPYDKTGWWAAALEPPEETSAWPSIDRWKKVGGELLDRVGLGLPQKCRAKPGFEASHLARWLRAADAHRELARPLIARLTAGTL